MALLPADDEFAVFLFFLDLWVESINAILCQLLLVNVGNKSF